MSDKKPTLHETHIPLASYSGGGCCSLLGLPGKHESQEDWLSEGTNFKQCPFDRWFI